MIIKSSGNTVTDGFTVANWTPDKNIKPVSGDFNTKSDRQKTELYFGWKRMTSKINNVRLTRVLASIVILYYHLSKGRPNCFIKTWCVAKDFTILIVLIRFYVKHNNVKPSRSTILIAITEWRTDVYWRKIRANDVGSFAATPESLNIVVSDSKEGYLVFHVRKSWAVNEIYLIPTICLEKKQTQTSSGAFDPWRIRNGRNAVWVSTL